MDHKFYKNRGTLTQQDQLALMQKAALSHDLHLRTISTLIDIVKIQDVSKELKLLAEQALYKLVSDFNIESQPKPDTIISDNE